MSNFSERHNGLNESDINKMLKDIGVDSIDMLIDQTIPSSIKLNKALDLPNALSESRFLEHMHSLAKKNKNYRSYIGMGYFNTILPSVIQRNVLENPGWYTAYTPYQAEIAQGRLEALLNFQTMICDLSGMQIANSSLLDEGTAAAEAMAMLFNNMSRSKKKSGANKFFVSELCYPQTIEILKTRSEPLNIELIIGDHNLIELSEEFFGIILQYPAKYGEVLDYTQIVERSKSL